MTLHSINQALKRYNIDLSFADIDKIIHLIITNKSIPLPDVPTHYANMKFHYVKYKNIPLKVLYKKGGGKLDPPAVITLYPLDVDEYNKFLDGLQLNKINEAKEYLKAKGYIVYKKQARS